MALLQSNGTIDGMQMNVIDIKLPSMITHPLLIFGLITLLALTECYYKLKASEKRKQVFCVNSQIRANRIFGTLSKFN